MNLFPKYTRAHTEMHRVLCSSARADSMIDSQNDAESAGELLTRLATYNDETAAFAAQPLKTAYVRAGDSAVRIVVEPSTLGPYWRFAFTDPLEFPVATYNTGSVGPFQVLTPDPSSYGDDGVHGTGNGSNFDMRFSPSAALLPSGNAPRTITFWFRLGRNNSTPRTNFVRYGNSAPFFGVTWSNSTNTITFTSQGSDLVVPHVYTDAEALDWHLYTATYDGTTKRLYFDATEIGNQVPGPQTTSVAGFFDIFSSNPPHSNGRHFIDDLRVYPTALSVPSITALVTARIEAGPVCRYQLVAGSAADTGTRGNFPLQRPASSLAYIADEGSANATGNLGVIEFRGDLQAGSIRSILHTPTTGLPVGAASRTMAFWIRCFHPPPGTAGGPSPPTTHQTPVAYGIYEANGAGTKNGFALLYRSSNAATPPTYVWRFGSRSFVAPGSAFFNPPFSSGVTGSGAWEFHAVRYTNVREGEHVIGLFFDTTPFFALTTSSSLLTPATTQASGDLTFGKFADNDVDDLTLDYFQVSDFRLWDRAVDSDELVSMFNGGLVLPDLIYFCPPGNATGRSDKSYGYSQWSVRSVGGYGGQRLANSGTLIGTAVGGLQHYAVRAHVDYKTRGWNTGLPPGGLYTLAFWFRQTIAGAINVNAFSIGDAGAFAGHIGVHIRSGPDRIVIEDGGEAAWIHGASPAVGTWQHIAFTANSGGEAYSVYYNGAPVVSDYNAPSVLVYNQTNENPRFGSASGHDFYNLRVYRSRKSDAEIAALYAAENVQNPIYNWLSGCRFDVANITGTTEFGSGRVHTTFDATAATFKLRDGPGPGDYKMNAMTNTTLLGDETIQGISFPAGDAAITMTCWFRFVVGAAGNKVMMKYGAPLTYFAFGVDQSTGTLRVDTGTQIVSVTGLTITANVWYMFTAAYDPAGSVTRFYQNGTLVGTPQATTDLGTVLSGVGGFLVGLASVDHDIADARLYDATLTTAQVLELYNTYT